MHKLAFKSQLMAVMSWFFYALTVAVFSVLLVWASYAQVDYSYRFWYQQLDIADHIATYGPQNRFKEGFEQLPAEQHWRAFEQINRAVLNQGDGLARIEYQPPGAAPRPLLHQDEVHHLQDVAWLMDKGGQLLLITALLWLPLALLCARQGMPALRWRLTITVFSLGAVIAWLLIAGPTRVFYQFHHWLFPADHAWFFYWQDSLMSTLMKAPVLFGGIAAVIALGAALLAPFLYWLGLRWMARFNNNKTRS